MVAPRTPPSNKTAVDGLLDRFEAEWRTGRPTLEAYLAEYAGPAADELLCELVCLDVVYRRKTGGWADVAEYADRVPAFARLPAADREWVEQAVRRSAPALPAEVGKYRVLALLAEGGQAVAYRALRPDLNQPVVLKVARRTAAPAFRAEAEILANLLHPNVVRMFDLTEWAGRPVLVLEDIPGRTLEEYATAEGPNPRRAAAIVAGAARGLGAAHRRGVLHLDVSPNNILIDPEGRARVIDFGLAQQRGWLSADESPPLGGSLGYLAPEQTDETPDRLGPRTDVFGLGAVLYRLLTGVPLYAGGSAKDLLARARARDLDERRLDAPHIPPDLRRVCRKALATDPADRYANGDELAAALDRSGPRPLPFPVLLGLLFLSAVGLMWYVNRPAAPLGDPELDVTVWKGEDGYRPLLQALPARPGAELQFRTRVPRGSATTLYLVNGRGELQVLARYEGGEADHEEVFPATGKTVELGGPAGTEFVLAVSRHSGSNPDAEVRRLWEAAEEWPSLPDETVLLVRPDRVRYAEPPRDMGPVRDRPDPAELVRQRLEGFRARLREAGFTCNGLAFGHP